MIRNQDQALKIQAQYLMKGRAPKTTKIREINVCIDEKILTNDSGKDENDDIPGFDETLENMSGFSVASGSGAPASLGLSFAVALAEGSSFPCFFNQFRIGGSSPAAQLISTPSRPRSFRPLAPTAANAPPIWRNGTSAVPFLGGFVGAFLGGLSERTIDEASISPNCVKREAIDEVLLSSGCDSKVYFSFTVVSSCP